MGLKRRRNQKGEITPIPIPSGEMKRLRAVLVFGGTFDPPHAFHTVGPMLALTMLYGGDGWLLYVPAAQNPLKGGRAGGGVGDADRLKMLELALDVPGRRSIWTDELDRARGSGQKRASYTIETLRRLRKVLAKRIEIRLVIGADQAAVFHRWRGARQILELARPIVMLREPITTSAELWVTLTETGFWTREEVRRWCEWIAPTLVMPAASTTIREALSGAPGNPRAWAKDDALRYVPTNVAGYIAAHHLYRVSPGSARGS